MNIKIIAVAVCIMLGISNNASAQIKTDDLFGKVQELLGKKQLLTVRKGYSPVFNLGNFRINDVGILGEKLKGVEVLGSIFNSKGVQEITKLYKTYKTGLVIYKILSAAGSLVTVYSTVRGVTASEKFDDKTVRSLLAPGLTSLLTGVVTKLLTKRASYKAVDTFNGAVQKKIKEILSVAPASSNMGIGLYVNI